MVTTRKGKPEPDPDLRDNENVPLPEGGGRLEEDPSGRLASLEYRAAVDDYVAAEVLPYVRTPGSTTPRRGSATRFR